MGKPKYSSLLGLKANQGYSVLFKENSNQLKSRKYGEMSLKVGKVIGDISNKSENLLRNIICDISLDSFSVENPMGNDNNPREGVYDKKREDTLVTVFEKPEFLPDTSIGISIMCKNLHRKDGRVYFTIPHKEITSLDTDESKQKKKKYNQRFGVYDGQNVYYILLTYIQEILKQNSKVIEYSKVKTIEDLKNVFIRVEFREYSDDTSNEDLAWICKARNTNVTQSETNLLALSGAFNQYFDFSKYAKSMVATKLGEELYSISDILVENHHLVVDKDEFCKDTEDSENTFSEYNLVGKMSIDDYFIYMALTGYSALLNKKLVKLYKENGISTMKYSEYTRSKKSKFKNDALFNLSSVFIEKEIEHTKSTTSIVRKMQAANKTGMSEFDYLYTPVLVDSFLKFFDFVTFFDYSSYDSDKLLKIGILPTKQNIVSSITKTAKKYNMGKMVMKFIPIIFGALCRVVEDEDTGIFLIVPDVDAELFWKKNWKKILDMLYDCYVDGINHGLDKWFYYMPRNEVSYTLWFKLYSFIREYSEKAVGQGTKMSVVHKQVNGLEKSKKGSLFNV